MRSRKGPAACQVRNSVIQEETMKRLTLAFAFALMIGTGMASTSYSYSTFHITPDPAFLYSSPSHGKALAAMICGVQNRKGFIAVTGDVGLGKRGWARPCSFAPSWNAWTKSWSR